MNIRCSRLLRFLGINLVVLMAGTVMAYAQRSDGNKVYYESGEVHYEYGLERGVLQGITKEYFRTGNIRFEWNYREGMLQGDVEGVLCRWEGEG